MENAKRAALLMLRCCVARLTRKSCGGSTSWPMSIAGRSTLVALGIRNSGYEGPYGRTVDGSCLIKYEAGTRRWLKGAVPGRYLRSFDCLYNGDGCRVGSMTTSHTEKLGSVQLQPYSSNPKEDLC